MIGITARRLITAKLGKYFFLNEWYLRHVRGCCFGVVRNDSLRRNRNSLVWHCAVA